MKALGAFTLGEGMKVEAGVHGQGEGKGEVPVDITLQSVLLLPLEETNLPGDRGGWYWSLKENLHLLSDAIFLSNSTWYVFGASFVWRRHGSTAGGLPDYIIE